MLKKLLENSMSKEREMIEKLCSFQMTYSDWLLLIADAEELLAQPEQEPVAWMVETHFNNEPIKEFHTVKPMERVYKYCKVTELYSAPLKPLTGIEISNGFKADDEATHPYSYWAGVEFAEKHHGIGGGCDE
jgi:hypothetical protein